MLLLFSLLTAGIGLAAGTSVSSLLFLLASAAWANRRVEISPISFKALALAVIVPAHNEELVLSATLDSLLAQQYPHECLQIVVVADNCSDGTAALARAQGVTVLERTHAEDRGKGFALNYAVASLLNQPIPPDGFIIVDADTWVAPDFLALLNTRLLSGQNADGYGAWQGRYGVLNSGDGWRTALMTAAFDLVNHVKPLGREAWHLSVGLKGNGMAFTRAVAAELPWPGSSLTEDLDYGLELARRFGVRVGYAPEARVRAQMPTTAAQAGSQRSRWERGRLRMVRERALPLLWEGLRDRNRLLFDMGFDLLVPPLAELSALIVVWCGLILLGAILALLPYPLIWIGAASATILGLLVYILGGLRVAGAPSEAYAALLRAPFYAVWKFTLLLGGKGRRKDRLGAEEWVRTERAPLPMDPSATEVPPQ